MKTKLLISLLSIVVLLSAIIVFSRYEFHKIKEKDALVLVIHKKPDAKMIKEQEENELKRRAPIDIPDASIVPIQEIKDNKKPVIAFFYVDWCGYCKRFMPIYGEVAKAYKDKFNFTVVHCEKEENAQIVKEFEIQGFPTLFIIDKKIDYKFPLSGNVTQDKEALEKELDKYLNVRKHFTK